MCRPHDDWLLYSMPLEHRPAQYIGINIFRCHGYIFLLSCSHCLVDIQHLRILQLGCLAFLADSNIYQYDHLPCKELGCHKKCNCKGQHIPGFCILLKLDSHYQWNIHLKVKINQVQTGFIFYASKYPHTSVALRMRVSSPSRRTLTDSSVGRRCT